MSGCKRSTAHHPLQRWSRTERRLRGAGLYRLCAPFSTTTARSRGQGRLRLQGRKRQARELYLLAFSAYTSLPVLLTHTRSSASLSLCRILCGCCARSEALRQCKQRCVAGMWSQTARVTQFCCSCLRVSIGTFLSFSSRRSTSSSTVHISTCLMRCWAAKGVVWEACFPHIVF